MLGEAAESVAAMELGVARVLAVRVSGEAVASGAVSAESALDAV